MLAVLVAVSSAFSPTALSPRSAVSLRVRSVSAPVAMAGWNDEYQDNDPGRKKQVCACATFSPAVCDAHRPCCTHTHTWSGTWSVCWPCRGRSSRPIRPISMRRWHALARSAAWTVPRRPSSDFRCSSWPTSSIWWWQAERYLLPSSAVLARRMRGHDSTPAHCPGRATAAQKQVLCWLEALCINWPYTCD